MLILKKILNLFLILMYMVSCILLIDKLRIIVNIQELLIMILIAISILLIFSLLFKFNILNIISHISIFLISILLFGINTTSETVFNFVDGIVTNTNIIDNYRVIVLKDKYDNINQLENKNVGYTKDTIGINNIQIKFENICFNSLDELLTSLDDEDIEGALILQEQYDELANKDDYEIIYELKFKEEIETVEKELLGGTTHIYVSGMDNYEPLTSTGRSDVNMVMVVNPKIRQILLVSIPRDYYVQLHGTTGNKDKLTHAGIYGIDMSINTIEDLLELDINYYIKVNFTSVIDIVDAIGGLDVYSEYTFTSYSGYKFKKGMNSVNGKQALDFARTRKAFIDGDRQRGKNQQAIIEAIVRKVTDKSIITKYSSLLDAIDGKYQTNLGMKKVLSLVKMQLKDMSPWTVTSYSLTGKDAKDYTYTYNQLLYVMKPDPDSINEAIKLIDDVLNDEQLETSYNDLGGSSNKVTQVQSNTNQQTETLNDKKEEILNDDLDQEIDDSKEDQLGDEIPNTDNENSEDNDDAETPEDSTNNTEKEDEPQTDSTDNPSTDLDDPLQNIISTNDTENN